ncbi:MAG: hypothetical protein AAF127_13600 [Pseudomonadota bacterium]
MSEGPEASEKRAASGYALMQLARVGGLAGVIAGIAGSRDVLPIPFALAAALAVAGMVTFFFVPTLIARRFRTREDRSE